MKWLAVLNPRAGNHSPARRQAFARRLETTLGADLAWTAYPWHAAEIVRRHPEVDGIIAVGGDGTVAEVAAGLDLNRQHLGILPVGTGNGIVRDFGLMDPEAALEALRRPRFARLDLVEVHYRSHGAWASRTMINTAAVGYVAGATALGMHPLKAMGPAFGAVTAVVQCFRQRPFAARLRVGDEPWRQLALTSLAVHNTQYIGAFRLFPEASPFDGRLDLLLAHLTPLGQLLDNLGTLLRVPLHPGVTRRQARYAEIELLRPDVVMIDGELFADVDRIRFEVVPARLSCCVGQALVCPDHDAIPAPGLIYTRGEDQRAQSRS